MVKDNQKIDNWINNNKFKNLNFKKKIIDLISNYWKCTYLTNILYSLLLEELINKDSVKTKIHVKYTNFLLNHLVLEKFNKKLMLITIKDK